MFAHSSPQCPTNVVPNPISQSVQKVQTRCILFLFSALPPFIVWRA